MSLPVYEMVINPEEGSEVEVAAVAFVDKPAIERNFLAFKDQRVNFAINEDRRIVSGPAMVADQLIYRKDENGEYNVFFSPDTIREIALKFFKKDYQKNLNLFHDSSAPLQGITIFESFVSDKSRGIMPMAGFEDLPDGSWFISAKIENDEVWNAIKAGQVKGFSVEGIFSFMKINDVNRPVANSAHFNEDQRNFMSDLKDLFNKFFGGVPAPAAPAPAVPAGGGKETMSAEYKLKDGTVVTAEVLEPGGVLMVGDAPAPAGTHEFEDGTKVTVGEGGVIQTVEPAQAPADPNAAAAQNPNDYSEQFKSYDEKFTALGNQFSNHMAAFTTMAGEFAEQKKQIANLIQLVGQMIETPTAPSVQGDKGQFNSHTSKKDDKIKELNKLFQSIKKK